MKNIKTSKIVALVLSIAMILNVFAGLSLTSFAADITVGMYFMDQNNGYSTPSEFVAGQSYTAVVTLANYNATNAAAYPISGLQIDVAIDSKVTTGYVGTYEKSGYSFDGTTNFASKTTDENGNAIVRFASVYGAPNADGSFEYSSLAASDKTIEIMAFVFTVAENATGTVSFPMTVTAADASLAPYEFVVNSRTMNVAAAATKTEISLYGPDLEAINSEGTYNIDDATKTDGNGYTPFGTSWLDAGFAAGSSVVRMGYNNYVYLGKFDFSNVTKIEITYATDASFPAANPNLEGAVYSLGLRKSAGSFGWAEPIEGIGVGTKYEDVIAVGPLSNGTSNGWGDRRVVTITDGIDTSYSGDTWLTSYACNGHIIAATSVVLYRSENVDSTTTPSPTTTVAPTTAPTATPDATIAFNFNTDAITADGVSINASGIGGNSKFVWSKYGHLPTIYVTESFVIQGWLTSNYNIAAYEYSVNGGEWIDLGSSGITERADLAATNPDTYTTAGYNLSIPATGLTADTLNTLDIRFVDTEGNKVEFIQYSLYNGAKAFTEFHSSIDWYWIDAENNSTNLTGVGGAGVVGTIADTITITDYVRFAGWVSTAAGISGYEYSLDNGATWIEIEGEGILARPDLVTANIPYATTGADTAGFDFFIEGEAFAEGTNALTVRAVDLAGNKFKIFTATVVYEAPVVETPTYTVSVGTVSNGTVSVAPNGTVDEGTTVTVTATPATGYELSEILVNGTAITGTTFTVTADSVVTATFKKVQYAVSVGTVSNGTVTLSATGNVDYGTTITVTATPATGYKLDKILVNGTAISGTTFTVTAASTVTATFTKIQYAVSVGTVSNGTVTLSKTGNVDYGTTITVTATPAADYELDKILVNGTAITGTTFTVTADAVVTATFAKKAVEVETYTITIVKGGKGTGNVTVVASAKAGETITLTTAGTVNTSGLACVTTLIESADVTLTTSKVVTSALTGATFTMPAKNVTITVNFQILGDADLNGRINVSDTRAVKAHASKDTLLTGEKLIVANVAGTSNATVNVMDTRAVKAVASKETTIFQNGTYN